MNTKTSQRSQSQTGNSYGSPAVGESGNVDLNPLTDLQTYAQEYVKQQPEMAALICLGVGFVLGWKLKPW